MMWHCAKAAPETYHPFFTKALYQFGSLLYYYNYSLQGAVSFLEEAAGIERHLRHGSSDYRSNNLQQYLLQLSSARDFLGQHQRSLNMLSERVNQPLPGSIL